LKFRILVYYLTPEIFVLIQKVLKKFDFGYKFVNIQNDVLYEIEEKIFFECKNYADIVILDQELDIDFKTKLIKKFDNIDFICLPSLDENDNIDSLPNVKQISEPFRLSEFEEVLVSIINSKSETDVQR
jgi:hypothetical protein